MSLSWNDAIKLSNDGFTNREINLFAEAVDPTGKPQPEANIESPLWLSVRQERRDLIGRLQDDYFTAEEEELTREMQDRIIDSFGPQDPFDWLKKIYQPKGKAPTSDVAMSVKEAAEARTRRLTEMRL